MRPDSAPSANLTKKVILRRLRESYPQLTAQFGGRRMGYLVPSRGTPPRNPATST